MARSDQVRCERCNDVHDLADRTAIYRTEECHGYHRIFDHSKCPRCGCGDYYELKQCDNCQEWVMPDELWAIGDDELCADCLKVEVAA